MKVYGFDAKEAEAVIISGTKGDKRESRLHIVGDKDGDGFTRKEIRDFDTNKLTPMETKISKRVSDNYDVDIRSSPSPASVEPPYLPRNHSRKNRQTKTFQPKMKKKFGNIMFMFPIHLLMIFSLLMMQEILELKKGQSKRHMKFQRIKRGKGKMVYVVAEEREMDIEEVIYRIDEEGDVLNAETEVKEALGLFGKKDEKEEKEEPKTSRIHSRFTRRRQT